jgi:hypothetical protein
VTGFDGSERELGTGFGAGFGSDRVLGAEAGLFDTALGAETAFFFFLGADSVVQGL